jgi:hypothetical protein
MRKPNQSPKENKPTNLLKEYKLSRLKSRSIMKMALFQKDYSLTTSYVQIKYFQTLGPSGLPKERKL